MPRIMPINNYRPSSGHPGRDLPLPWLRRGQAKDELVRGRRAVMLGDPPLSPSTRQGKLAARASRFAGLWRRGACCPVSPS